MATQIHGEIKVIMKARTQSNIYKLYLVLYFQLIYLQQAHWIFVNYSDKMRKDQVELIKNINDNQKIQYYLFETPKTPQQQFLHLFAHKNLIKKNIFHYNLDKIFNLLEGSFIGTYLRLNFVAARIQNKAQISEISPLLQLVEGWVNYYPTIKTNQKCILGQIILQNSLQYEEINSFELFLTYLNIISPDLWKILRNTRSHQYFEKEKLFKDDLQFAYQLDIKRFETIDLLSFLNGCLPKHIYNIILDQDNIPPELKDKYKRFQCLFSNQNYQYFLRNCNKLALVMRQVLLILIITTMAKAEQKNLALVAMRYYLLYHHDKKYSAPQILIYVLNKVEEQVHKELTDNYYLFFKILKKIGKNKFIGFLDKNSPFMKKIIEFVETNPIVGYPINAINPFNYLKISQNAKILRGAFQVRIFQVLQQLSIIYLTVKVLSLDITVRVWYLGQIESHREEKTKLITFQKIQQYSTSMIAVRRGLYMLQFDNTFSWINNKQVFYDIIVATPLDMQSLHYDEWTTQYYDNCTFNKIADEKNVIILQNKNLDVNKEIIGNAILERQKQLYSLKFDAKEKDQYYVYQTDNPERMKQKVKEILKTKKKEYLWKIKNKEVKHEDQLIKFIQLQQQNEDQPSSSNKVPEKSMIKESIKENKKQILAKYQSDEQAQNEIIQKQQKQSEQKPNKIEVSKLNQSLQVQKSTSNLLKSTIAEQKVQQKSKQIISQSYQQAEDI